jgi:histidinol-phosphate aminotransferase
MDYKSLARENILTIEPYKPGKSIDEIKEAYGLDNVIKMASNENPLGPSSKAKHAISEYLNNIHLYPLGDIRYLRRALSKKLKVNGDELIFGNGSDDIIEMLLLTFLKKGEHVLSAHPSFSEYILMSTVVGSFCKLVPLERNFVYNLDSIKKSIDSNTKIIFLCNPNNPTGTYFNKSEFVKFMDNVSPEKIVVLDEAYAEYAEAEDFPVGFQLRKNYNNLVIMRTFSKAYGLAGLRVGYAVADRAIVALMNRVRQPFNVNSLAQVAAIAALEDDMHLDKTISLNLEGKHYLYMELDKLYIKYIRSEANFIFIDVIDGLKVSEKLLKEGIIVRYMGAHFHEYIRVTIGTMRDNEIFIDKLKKVMGEVI